MNGACDVAQAMKSINYPCAVIGIPKTADNDIPMMDKTFGFDTACSAAVEAIHMAYTEATSNSNCIGLVKMMGRSSGIVTLQACLAALNVDVCLIPEMTVSLDKVLNYCLDVMQRKGHMVIVISDGCGEALTSSSGSSHMTGLVTRQYSELGQTAKSVDVGPWFREKLMSTFEEMSLPLTVKYIDPTYLVRAVKSNAHDSVFCTILAHNAIHAAMAGYTCTMVGKVQERYVLLPMQAIADCPPVRVDLKGRPFLRLMFSTMQPDFSPDGLSLSRQVSLKRESLVDHSDAVSIVSCFQKRDEVRRLQIPHLSSLFGERNIASPLDAPGITTGYRHKNSWVMQTVGREDSGTVYLQMLLAGPRRQIFFNPEEVATAIITCGGLCPGLNSVIREIVHMSYIYGVKKVYGITGGYKGVVTPHLWMTLTPDNVNDIHKQGGTILQSDRGHPSMEEQFESLKAKGIRQYFIIGGDGTHLGAMAMAELMMEKKWSCAVIGIPKTIDNDLPMLDRTFGFDTAMTEAVKSIDVAYTEAKCNANCIGLVKLMGRHCGQLTMMSCVAARRVDVCLLPEMSVDLKNVLEHLVALIQKKGAAVIVVAEGCAATLMKDVDTGYDAGGNKLLPEVGAWMKEQITKYFKNQVVPVTVKYVDPTYSVRAVPANANDSVYCSSLAAAAVNAAMAGYTACTTGKIDDHYVILPIRLLVSVPNNKVWLDGRWYERLMATTNQPSFSPDHQEPVLEMVRRMSSGLEDIEKFELAVPDVSLTVLDGFGAVKETRDLTRSDMLRDSDMLRVLHCHHLSLRYGGFQHPSPLTQLTRTYCDSESWCTQAFYLGDSVEGCSTSCDKQIYYRMTRAGPREFLHFDPHDPAACAAIVSCGGICPGLNAVIREIVMMLWTYGVRRIWGIKGGFKGVVEPDAWIRLTPELVKDIHLSGGTMLVSDRGNPPTQEMAKMLQKHMVKKYFVLGGDGTHKGAMATYEACEEIGYECAVVGVPKTIDNDVPIFDQTFGFDTACTEAIKAVNAAYVEASCNANAIGLVKLMGRHCGWIAMTAAIAARTADICLLPEMNIEVEKVIQHAMAIMKKKGRAVIVVAEGCGDTMIKEDLGLDAGGNKIMPDVGVWLKDAIMARFKKEGLPLTIKYIDPTYMIRSVPANAFDSAYCSSLAQNAVHAAMAGYTGITVGKVHERMVYVPIEAITTQPGRRVNPKGHWFWRLLQATGQPDFNPDGQRSLQPVPSGDIMMQLSEPCSINGILNPGDRVVRLGLANLREQFRSAKVPNHVIAEEDVASSIFVDESAWCLKTITKRNKFDDQGSTYYQLLRSGARKELHFDPAKGAACIVTCGGLCPGLNSVIREVVNSLTKYGVKDIYGCKGGYKGMVMPDKWIKLTPAYVEEIHSQGGTILVSDRGNPSYDDIAKSLQSMNVKQFFVIGGDGTQMGAAASFEACRRIDWEVAVMGIPKTIDNDIPIMDRSFGFNTACTEAEKAIDAAYVESRCRQNCIGLVKLMGRSSGYIAMEATLAARTVDVCLIPEMNISLPKLLTHALELIRSRKRAVFVVAEGCGDTLIKSSGETDAGGNRKLADVGPWLIEQLEKHFETHGVPLTVRYIDPTYMVRAVPANPNDSVYCAILAQQAVHNAMAGYTGAIVGKVDERYVMIPIHAITANRGRKVDLKGRQFERLIASTSQPDLTPSIGNDWALMKRLHPPPRRRQLTQCDSSMLEMPSLAGVAVKASAASADVFAGSKFKVFDPLGELKEERELRFSDILLAGSQVRRLDVPRCGNWPGLKKTTSNLKCCFASADSWAVQSFSTTDSSRQGLSSPYFQMLRAGPREDLHFDPDDADSCAAICTAGTLCPGENVIIREVYRTLKRYGMKRIYGVLDGFGGIQSADCWLELTPEIVQDIHTSGGTCLRTSRKYRVGDPREYPNSDTVAALKEKNVRQLYLVGGDGTLKGAACICDALQKTGHDCAVVTVPSTVENDIPITDWTFGFNTACMEARCAVDCAYVEARCNANAIGLVKLGGSKSGHLALYTTLASRHVDICLLPEMDIDLEKLLDHCEKIMAKKGYAVIIVSEGCNTPLLLNTGEDPHGVDAGPWLKGKITERFKKADKPLTIKYIDPTHMIRAIPAAANDSVYCSVLAEHAVHGAMAGLTSFTVARVYERMVYIPLAAVNSAPLKKVNQSGRFFARMLFTTNQPSFTPASGSKAARPRTESTAEEIRDLFLKVSEPVELPKILEPGLEIHRLEVMQLSSKFPSRQITSPIKSMLGREIPEDNSWLTQTIQNTDGKLGVAYQMLRSGIREKLHFDPREEGACGAIVTCGGLCPGLNSVIRAIVMMLRSYGVKDVYGIKGGFKGCVEPEAWIDLTEDYVQDIHMKGGSVLVSDRGNPAYEDIAKTMKSRKVRWFFVVGGDGTHKGAMAAFEAMTSAGHECAVCGIPKTIDNDIQMLDRTFGFDTAFSEAKRAIDSAYVEATTNANCIGLVKLMGRHCGWIAAMATLASRCVDVCLVPEMNISLTKLLDYVEQVMRKQRYAVIVVAEGCGDTIISSGAATDAGGNKILADIGPFLKDRISSHLKKQGLPITIKYIDPTYMIRAVPANAFDSGYCSTLAQQAVHGVMSGYTGFTVGKVDQRHVMLPIHAITKGGPRKMDRSGRWFERLLGSTLQPSFDE
eukprot:TRINITY_DN860_c0_g2_i1.p1 TRINITY_DN860_c0_g2~~TRINITY_DN860_c0_g2_i1.p1  ORF type:complete len:2777 (-),score=621.22 TRINITY_DN860_c0_g2_i1:77-8053(-)